MPNLTHTHLLDLELIVDFRSIRPIGKIAAGMRQIAPIVGGTFKGEELNGTIEQGSDWFLFLPDGTMKIDVRATMKTDDGIYIYLNYQGYLTATAEVMARFAKGALLAPEEYNLAMTARFECGHPRYNWLNHLITVGQGIQTKTGPIYSIYKIG
ncbi:MAG: DUF3237 domain-containing protein [Saprospiraceae bacterium]